MESRAARLEELADVPTRPSPAKRLAIIGRTVQAVLADHPNERWGTDGIRIETLDEGRAWVFSAVDHFDACCVGTHVVKTGHRLAALPPCRRSRRA